MEIIPFVNGHPCIHACKDCEGRSTVCDVDDHPCDVRDIDFCLYYDNRHRL